MSDTPNTLQQVDADINESWETIDGIIDGFFAALPKIAIGIVVFLVFWLIARTVRSAMKRAKFGDDETSTLSTVFARLAFYAIMIIGLFVALTVILPSLTPGQLISGLGIGGLAIGFAFQDIFQNLLAGIMILIRQPFKVGDEIESGDFSGRVEAIETRATFIRTFDNRRVIIPNSQIYSDPLKVMTAYDIRRSEYDVGIGYGDDIATAKETMLEAIKSVEGVLTARPAQVLVSSLDASWITLRARWWTDAERSQETKVRSDVIEAIAGALTKAGIDMPFDTQVVLFHDQTEETDGDRAKQREGWPTVPDKDPKPAKMVDAMRERAANRNAKDSA
ncbi:mechanosensitive ion channel family protein [Sphingomicrobium clamense]|uniref:Small-conductance mechanosensitive channel n=1 Tax=Sphingomicrobium clamense TaxID=2851013 RepID=A0ABS6V7I5_9SPHN|nr:mechanosensitive ion channel family protein [Sphingomicrobium sp. B8]MBW0145295.1 mechanosensitive ion channel family protein [Sphingomicrobium sp. B8]